MTEYGRGPGSEPWHPRGPVVRGPADGAGRPPTAGPPTTAAGRSSTGQAQAHPDQQGDWGTGGQPHGQGYQQYPQHSPGESGSTPASTRTPSSSTPVRGSPSTPDSRSSTTPPRGSSSTGSSSPGTTGVTTTAAAGRPGATPRCPTPPTRPTPTRAGTPPSSRTSTAPPRRTRRREPPGAAPRRSPSRRPTGTPGPTRASTPSSPAATRTTTPTTTPRAGGAAATARAGAAQGPQAAQRLRLPGGRRGLRRGPRRRRLFRLPLLPEPLRLGARLRGRRIGPGDRRDPQGRRRLRDRPEPEGARASSRAWTPSSPRQQENPEGQKHPGRRLHAAQADVGGERRRADARPQEPEQRRRGSREPQRHGLRGHRQAARSLQGDHRQGRGEGLQEPGAADLGEQRPAHKGSAGRIPLPVHLRVGQGDEARERAQEMVDAGASNVRLDAASRRRPSR